MPEWTTEAIVSLSGALLVAVVLGWAIGRFGGSRVARADYERTAAEERTARHELTAAKARSRRLEDELASLTANLAERATECPVAVRATADATGADPSSTHPAVPTRALRDASPQPDAPADAVGSAQLAGVEASLLEELGAARLRFARVHASQAELAAELERVRGRVADLERHQEALGSGLGASTRRVDELDELQTRIDRHLREARRQVARFEARTGARADELSQARARVGEVEASLQHAVAALRDTRSELDAIGVDLRTLPSVDETPPPVDVTPADAAGRVGVNGSIDLTTESHAEAIDLREPDRSPIDAAADAADAAAERRSGGIETWRA